MDGRGVTTPTQSVKKGGAVIIVTHCLSYPPVWQTHLGGKIMSKAHIVANEHKNLREQIMFHLSFSLMMKFSGRDENTVKIVEEYAKTQGLWASDEIVFTDTLTLDAKTNILLGSHNDKMYLLISACYVDCSKFNSKFNKMIKPIFSRVEKKTNDKRLFFISSYWKDG